MPYIQGDEEFRIADKQYGKSFVKLLHIKRDGLLHSIREYEVDTKLTLDTEKDYTEGDNAAVIATDSQKNTVYLLAKKHGVGTPEQFALLLCKHFLDKYNWVNKAYVHVEAHPWQRIEIDGRKHNHAFISTPVVDRYATVVHHRYLRPIITAGLKNLRVLKTTQSAFVDFVSDEYRSLPDMHDRVFSTIVASSWEYGNLNNLNFDRAFEQVYKTILLKFAGEPIKGAFSPSVQQTMYQTETEILQLVPQINWIHMVMPNKHYFTVDLSKFPSGVGSKFNDEVFLPVDKPSGMIEAKVERKNTRARL